MQKVKGAVYLFCAALFWGIAFVAQDVGVEFIEPFTFTAERYFLGGITLLIVCLIISAVKRKKYGKTEITKEERKKRVKELLISGVICGLFLSVATNLQQIGLVYTTAGKSGFITSCYIVMVPIVGLFFKKKCPIFVWIAVPLTLVGLYFLCLAGGTDGFNKGDLITLGCAVAFTAHIMSLDKFVGENDPIQLTCVQCFVVSLTSAIPALIFETPSFHAITQAYIPLLYTGIMSAGVAYMCQSLGQEKLNPTLACIIMSAESVISVISAWIILHQELTWREALGCGIIFAAIIIAQLPDIKKKDKKGVEENAAETHE